MGTFIQIGFITYSLIILFPGLCLSQSDTIDLEMKREEIGKMYDEIARLFHARDYHAAIEINKIQLDDIKKYLGKRDSLYGTSLNSMAVLYRRMGKNAEAFPFYEKAIEHARETFGEEHPAYGHRIYNMAEYYRTIGKFEKSEELFYKSLAIAESNFGTESAEYGEVLNNLARLKRNMGNYTEAALLYEAAMEIARDKFGKDHLRYNTTVNNLAVAYRHLGKWDKAYPLYLEAVEITALTMGEQHPTYARRLNNLSIFYQDLGQLEKALELSKEALEITEKTLGATHRDYGARLNNIAFIYQAQGKLEDAALNYKKALAVFEVNPGKNQLIYGIALENIAATYMQMNNYEKAADFFYEAREIISGAVGEEHPAYANILASLGDFYLKKGELETALNYLNESIEVTASTLGEMDSDYATRLAALAKITTQKNDYQQALDAIEKANHIYRKRLRQVVAIGSEREKTDFLNTFYSFFDQVQSFGYQYNYSQNRISIIIYENAIALNSLIFNSTSSMLREVRNSDSEEIISLFENWRTLKNKIAGEYSKNPKERIALTDSLEAAAEKMEGQLVRHSAGLALGLQAIQYDDISSQLHSNEIAIEFSHFRKHRHSDSVIYTAILIDAEIKSPLIIPLFEEKELGDIFVRNEIATERDYINGIYGRSDAYLYQLIFKHLEPYLHNKSTVYYAPSGLLHQLNLNAIIDQNGQFLGEKYHLIRLRNTANLLKTMESTVPENIFLAGGIDYGTPPENPMNLSDQKEVKPEIKNRGGYPERKSESKFWEFLPGTLDEVQILAELFSGASNISILTGKEVSKSAIKKLDGRSPDVLHISTHGFFLPNMDHGYNSGEKRLFEIENPLLRSGLIMAGANAIHDSEVNSLFAEDGLLTALEISNLDLSNTHLVVLAACETGLGDIRSSEGVFGLQRAFKLAGTDFLVMSQWKVPDKITAEFMESFYTNWLTGLPIRKSFREAQLEMASKYPPYYWGGFILTGGGIEKTVTQAGWNSGLLHTVLISTAIALLLGLMLLRSASHLRNKKTGDQSIS